MAHSFVYLMVRYAAPLLAYYLCNINIYIYLFISVAPVATFPRNPCIPCGNYFENVYYSPKHLIRVMSSE